MIEPRPPAHLEPFVRALGVDLAIQVLLRFGGAELYLSTSPTARSQLVAEVGMEAAERLAAEAELAGSRWQRRVPTGKPWIAAVWHSRGLPKQEIARRLHVTDKAVREMLKKALPEAAPKSDPRQASLF